MAVPQLFLDEFDQFALLDVGVSILHTQCQLVTQLGFFLLALYLDLQLSVGDGVHGNGIGVEFEAQARALAVPGIGMSHLKDGAMLLDIEHVAALLAEHGSDVPLHVLVFHPLVLVHDHDDAAVVLVG